ncbi:MAG: hypothetical protein AB9903_34285 [Vulcanimicrobiota bacterium]
MKASIDDFIKNAYYRFTERDIHPEVNYGEIVRADPDYQQAEASEKALEAEVKKYLPEKAHQLFNDYVNALTDTMNFEPRYSYKHGFIDGVAYSRLPERWAAELGIKPPEVKTGEKVECPDLNNIIKAQFNDYQENDYRHEFYQSEDWRNACEKKGDLEQQYEEADADLDAMHNFHHFRMGFLYGMKHENGGLIQGGNA